MSEEIIQIGAVAILFLIAIKEFFAYLKNRKTNGRNGNINGVLSELKLINANHLRSIENAIKEGDKDVVNAINQGNQKIIELLGEIKGRLEK